MCCCSVFINIMTINSPTHPPSLLLYGDFYFLISARDFRVVRQKSLLTFVGLDGSAQEGEEKEFQLRSRTFVLWGKISKAQQSPSIHLKGERFSVAEGSCRMNAVPFPELQLLRPL